MFFALIHNLFFILCPTQSVHLHALRQYRGTPAPHIPHRYVDPLVPMQVAEGVHPTFVLPIIAQVHRRLGNTPRSKPQNAHVHPLLLLLPRSFHPAVVQACCVDASDYSHCVVSLSPYATDPRRECMHGSCTAASDTAASACARPSPTFDLLAAAALLAGGRGTPFASHAEDGGCAGGCSGSVGASERVPRGCSMHARAGKAPASPAHGQHQPASRSTGEAMPPLRLPAPEIEDECQTDSGRSSETLLRYERSHQFTRLSLTMVGGVDNTLQPAEPSRWCAALAQLSALRTLAVTVANFNSPAAFPVPAFTAALRRLPALTSLEIVYGFASGVDAAPVTAITADCTMNLLHGISRLPTLQHLELFNCISFARAHAESASAASLAARRASVAGQAVILQLSRLSNLRCLQFNAMVHSTSWAGVFAAAVKRMPALRELHVSLGATDPAMQRGGTNFLEELVSGPGLPALQLLDCALRRDRDSKPWGFATAPVENMHACMRLTNSALLTRMTALRLRTNCANPLLYTPSIESPLAGVGEFVADLPALRSLDLGGLVLSEDTLTSLAAAIPGMPGLTYLNIAGSCASEAAVLAMLAALLEHGAAGRDELRHLDISDNFNIGPDVAAELSGLLQHFSALQHLNISWLRLGLDGLEVVVQALEGLPRLQSVNACMNGADEAFDEEDLAEVFAGLAHVPELRYSPGVLPPLRLIRSLSNHLLSSAVLRRVVPSPLPGFPPCIRKRTEYPKNLRFVTCPQARRPSVNSEVDCESA